MLRIAICDDEQTDADRVRNLLDNYMKNTKQEYEVKMFLAGEALLKAQETFDIIFLDIEMPTGDGIEFGRQLSGYRDTYLIYVTSYVDYWKKAFNQAHAFAFLEKPLTLDMLAEQMKEIERDRTKKNARHKMNFEVLVVGDTEVKKELREFIVEDICYFEFVNRKIRLKEYDKEYFFIGRLGDVEEKCKEYGFARCHNAYVVNMRHISRVEKNEVYLDNGERVPLAQRKSAEFRKKVNTFIHII